jgi:hypothetical protein
VIVCDFNLLGISVLPAKAQAELIIDSDTVLPRPISAEALESISRRYGQFGQIAHPVELIQLSPRDRPEAFGASPPCRLRLLSLENILGAWIEK